MKKKTFNMNKMLLMVSMIPMLIAVIAMGVILAVISTQSVADKVEDQLLVAAKGLKDYTEYDLKQGEEEIAYDAEYIDCLKQYDVDLTVFIGDTRLCTSVLNDKGERNEGTQAAAGIWDKVSKGETFVDDNKAQYAFRFKAYFSIISSSRMCNESIFPRSFFSFT